MNDKMRQILNDYNWDDGFDLPKELLENHDCDLALALEIFFLADGYSYLIDNQRRTFQNPLTKVQRYKLKNSRYQIYS